MKIIEEITRMIHQDRFSNDKWAYLATAREFDELADFIKRFHPDEKDFIWPTSSMKFMGVLVLKYSE